MSYWVTFEDGTSGCVEFKFDGTEAWPERQERVKAATEAELSRKVSKVESLPYPANPRLITVEYEDTKGRKYNCPSFCFSPRECAGSSSCPKRYSCSD